MPKKAPKDTHKDPLDDRLAIELPDLRLPEDWCQSLPEFELGMTEEELASIWSTIDEDDLFARLRGDRPPDPPPPDPPPAVLPPARELHAHIRYPRSGRPGRRPGRRR